MPRKIQEKIRQKVKNKIGLSGLPGIPRRLTNLLKCVKIASVCGYGGTGRRAGFRFRWISVQVQILLPAPKSSAHVRPCGLVRALVCFYCNAILSYAWNTVYLFHAASDKSKVLELINLQMLPKSGNSFGVVIFISLRDFRRSALLSFGIT